MGWCSVGINTHPVSNLVQHVHFRDSVGAK